MRLSLYVSVDCTPVDELIMFCPDMNLKMTPLQSVSEKNIGQKCPP
jgi:hypothetical protein